MASGTHALSTVMLTQLILAQYVDLEGRQDHFQKWFEDNCGRLGLVGRIRVAKDGINVTVSF